MSLLRRIYTKGDRVWTWFNVDAKPFTVSGKIKNPDGLRTVKIKEDQYGFMIAKKKESEGYEAMDFELFKEQYPDMGSKVEEVFTYNLMKYGEPNVLQE